MFDLIYRFDPAGRHLPDCPTCPDTAVARLEDGNRRFARFLAAAGDPAPAVTSQVVRFDADDLGLPGPDGSPPAQTPFAAVLGCSDARVPTEMVLGQACNDLFVVRVAGNVLGAECLGSLDYALSNLGQTLRLVVVLGHSGCGAVTAAVDTFLHPAGYLRLAANHPLRAVVDRVFPAVRAAQWGLAEVYGRDADARPGYRAALIEAAVALNAALTAAAVRHALADRLGPDRRVVYGVYDLVSRRVKLPLEADGNLAIRLAPAPDLAADGASGFDQLAVLVAGGQGVRGALA